MDSQIIQRIPIIPIFQQFPIVSRIQKIISNSTLFFFASKIMRICFCKGCSTKDFKPRESWARWRKMKGKSRQLNWKNREREGDPLRRDSWKIITFFTHCVHNTGHVLYSSSADEGNWPSMPIRVTWSPFEVRTLTYYTDWS